MINLEAELEDYTAELKGVDSFIAEIKSTTAKLGTDPQQFETDLMEANHNAEFYRGEIARVKKELEASNSPQPKPPKPGTPIPIPKPPILTKPGIISLVLSPISFFAGALLGSRLKGRRDNKD